MTIFVIYPKVVAALQPWAEISERLRRNLLKIRTDARPYSKCHVCRIPQVFPSDRSKKLFFNLSLFC